MTKTVCAAVAVSICASSAFAHRGVQKELATAERLDQRIGRADPSKYKSIRDAKDWKNPYLVIHRGGIEVIANGLVSGRSIVPVAELQQTLLELPVTAWPYGRAAAVQEIGMRAGDRQEEELISGNLEAALAVLKKLRVVVNRWPS